MLGVNVEFLKSSMGDCALISLPNNFRAVSSAPRGFGILETSKVLILQVPKDYHSDRPEEELKELIKELKLEEKTIGLMTAAEIRKVLTVTHQSYEGLHVTVIITAGTSNALIAGEKTFTLKNIEESSLGTINIVALIDKALTDGALINAIITITEAKSIALRNLGFNASGTTTDSVVVACSTEGEKLKYAGTGTEIGFLLSRAVRDALVESLKKAGEAKSRNFLEKLEERGITLDKLLETAMELHIPDSEHGIEEVEKYFVETLNKLVNDVNINSLVCSAMFLEDLGSSGGIYGLSIEDFKNDAVQILADEIIGMAIAEYIAGTKGLFNYIRYDRKKPGIISSLGPFLDDVVASLIGGIMSNIYSKK
ncbi:MAG: bifunctional adenosylcobinamide hydrolase/alpha-ribazole phosphatase CbiS [Candidatus Jordarchaeaceae archaeon]